MILPERFWSCNALTFPVSIAKKGLDHIKSPIDLLIRDAVRGHEIEDISKGAKKNPMLLGKYRELPPC